ncbi:MAG: ABC transporter permease [Thermomicrobiales bacterium]
MIQRWSIPAADSRSISIGRPSLRGGAVLKRIALAMVVPLALLGIWQLVVEMGIYSRGQLPAPIDVWRAAEQLWNADLFWLNIRVSFERVLRGFVYGGVIAIALGLVVGLWSVARRILDPALAAARTIPSLAWVPLFVLWLGIGEQPKIMLIAIGAFFPIYTNLVSGIEHIDRKLIEAANAYGYKRHSLAWHVILPATLPSLMTGLRLGLAQAWLFLVAAELIGASRGLGFLLVDGQNSGRADVIVLAIILLAVVGKLCDVGLALIQSHLLRWADTAS